LRGGLRDLGYVEGKNIVIEFRSTETLEQLLELATELVRINVDLIFAPSSTETEVTRQVTNAIPVVFATHADPLGLGHVASLSRPGGNVTGLSGLGADLAVKALEILKDAIPHATRFAVFLTPSAPWHRSFLQAAKAAGAKLGIEVHTAPVQTMEDLNAAFAVAIRERADAIFVQPTSLSRSYRVPMAELALKHRLPSMFGGREYVEAGGLMSYAADYVDLTRRAATYIDKILKGAKPADLPVELASKYLLAINLTTAKKLEINLPWFLQQRADELIE
jgi:putative ABC transport system substrate-binding protein